MNIWFATNNPHKREELSAILNTPLKIPSDEGINFNPDEIYSTFHENALLKARELKKLLKEDDAVIADDSGLCVDILDGRPGVLSAYYGDTDGKILSGSEKNLLLLSELADKNNRSAYFVCSMALFINESRFYIVQETIEGEIVKDASLIKGDGGFGYDPIFYIPSLFKTMAELSSEEKNRISHRGKAGLQMAGIIKNLTHSI